MSKPTCFNAVKAMERIAELEKENAHLRGEIQGAKILIWQQKNLVRCRDCKHRNTYKGMDGELLHGCNCNIIVENDDPDFCSYGERKDNE